MARYLAYTSPARGHLYPIVPTLLELSSRGHEVHVRTLLSEVAALNDLGLHADRIAPEIEETPLADFEGTTPEEALAKALGTFVKRGQLEMPDLRESIAEVDPDALLVDITTIGAAALAESGTIPWAQSIPLFQHFSPDPSIPAEVMPVPFGIAPEPGLEVLNGPRREVGLEPIASPADMWRAPLHLYYTAEPFLPEGLALPASFEVVGPGVWEPPAPTPDWFEELAKPLVLVSASSEFQADGALIEAALAAFRSDDRCIAVSTAAHDPSGFDGSGNHRLARWLPHGRLLEKTACVVCHGGMGITQKALAAGVPVCVVPFGRDQFEVAARVVAARAGTSVPPDALDPTALRSAVHRAMEMREGAERVAESFGRAGGAPAAATALESLVGIDSEPLQASGHPQ